MDIASLGVDVSIIIAIGAIAERIKLADPDEKFKRFYLFIPVILSALAAVSIAFVDKQWANIPINIIKFFGVSSFGYSFIKKTLLKK